MEPKELKKLIESDEIALGFLNNCDDVLCASRCTEIAPKIPKKLLLSRIGILELYEANPSDGITVLKTIDAVSKNNPLVAEIASFMSPDTSPDSRPDFSIKIIRSSLTAPVEFGGLGLTVEQARPILLAGEQHQVITPIEVEYIRTRLWQ
jgi:hypothetical protein